MKTYSKDEITEFNRWVNNLNTNNNDTLALKYFHFVHTHFPIRFDENGVIQSQKNDWMASNQNEMGVRNQTIFALNQFIEFTEKLKEIDAYNKSLIILKSDHGKPTTYFNSSPLNRKINGNGLWGYSRYEPLLMIKDMNMSRDSMKISNNLVTLNDLSSTINSSVLPNDTTLASSNGINLLEESIDLSASRNIYINFVSDSTSNFKFDTHETHTFDRTSVKNLLDILESSGILGS